MKRLINSVTYSFYSVSIPGAAILDSRLGVIEVPPSFSAEATTLEGGWGGGSDGIANRESSKLKSHGLAFIKNDQLKCCFAKFPSLLSGCAKYCSK